MAGGNIHGQNYGVIRANGDIDEGLVYDVEGHAFYCSVDGGFWTGPVD
jgi:hypothetical protein